ncbi:MAG: hypothetical protein N4J56_004622 [Chroococcidiopsis sp. SAG 2025]|uniref:hypothetical protein n=1 Tax=Chroococcidiopsis sp. SAG 2025 TaxID=171389 RepID=UPI002936E48A|nr:hypothetical protein [Chroococcidiopsis sp. SAG 2025]MDV2994968.1 hypothetical protein [Chroococcidiopsis sp. SAG 2025]
MNDIEKTAKRRFIHTIFGSPAVTWQLFKDSDDLAFYIHKHNPLLDVLYHRAIAKDSSGFWSVFQRVNKDDVVMVIHLCYLNLQTNAPTHTLNWLKDELINERHHPYMKDA